MNFKTGILELLKCLHPQSQTLNVIDAQRNQWKTGRGGGGGGSPRPKWVTRPVSKLQREVSGHPNSMFSPISISASFLGWRLPSKPEAPPVLGGRNACRVGSTDIEQVPLEYHYAAGCRKRVFIRVACVAQLIVFTFAYFNRFEGKTLVRSCFFCWSHGCFNVCGRSSVVFNI